MAVTVPSAVAATSGITWLRGSTTRGGTVALGLHRRILVDMRGVLRQGSGDTCRLGAKAGTLAFRIPNWDPLLSGGTFSVNAVQVVHLHDGGVRRVHLWLSGRISVRWRWGSGRIQLRVADDAGRCDSGRLRWRIPARRA
jgi:hypothetical protein